MPNISKEQSLLAAIEVDYSKMAHSDLVLTCQMLARGRNMWREEAENAQSESFGMGCTLAGSGRGDCEHFVGLPGHSISGQHDGKDDTVDAYGKPNGWCWSCWKSYRLAKAEEKIASITAFQSAQWRAR